MFNRSRILAAYILAIPLALILGFLAAAPNEISFMLIGMLLFLLALPLLVKWHHILLIIFWNSVFDAFFLPGRPHLWLVFAALSFGLSVLNNIMWRKTFLPAAEMNLPLLFLVAVVLATGCYRGGIGIRILGGAIMGGKNYIYLLGAIMGYFALTAEPIPILKSRRTASLFFLSGASSILADLAYTLGPAFFILFYFVPADIATSQAASDYGLTNIDRIEGLAATCVAVFGFLLVHYGVRGLFDLARPWRLALLCLTIVAAFFAGFRSVIILLFLIFAFQFYFEGLLRTHFFPIVVGVAVIGIVPILLLSDKMPPAVQRAISFLPVHVDAEVQESASGSAEWRFQMWALVWKEVPKYLFIGKGYSIDPTEVFLINEAARRGMATSEFEGSIAVGDYHSGPLSVLIPFGLFGALAFLWVLSAGFRVLYSNYRYGDARLRRINTVLLSYYLAYVVSFFLIFGALNSQSYIFLGAVGLSVSLNGGVRRKPMPEYGRTLLWQAYAMEEE